MNKKTKIEAADTAPTRVYRGVNNEQRVAERRQRLLAAATSCFGTHGYHRTTLKMLCAEAGLTERYFYESFSNFDDILCNAYMATAAIILEKITAAIAKAPPTTHERMHAALDTYFATIGADKARARMLLIEIEGASERANETYRSQLEVSTDLIQRLICADLPAKPANGLSAQLMARSILGMVYQLAKDWAVSDFKLSRAALVRNVHAAAMGIVAVWQAEPVAPVVVKAVKKKKA